MSCPLPDKIVLAAESLAPGHGGICRVARLMAKVLVGARDRCAVWGISLSDSRPADLGLPIRTCSGSRWRFAEEVWKAGFCHRYFLYDFVGMARAHPRWLRRPFATFIHGVEVWEMARRDRVAWARRAALLLANSAYTRDRADRLHGGLKQAKVCWLATEEDEEPAEAADSTGPPTVMILGRIDPQLWKGHRELIEAWPRVVEAVPEARLLIVGTGQGAAQTQAMAAASPANRHIDFAGFVPDDRMADRWRSASVFAMPGVMEGFGLVYIEAMRQGVPVVASIHDAAPEINLDGVTGFNVDLTRPSDLADRLIDLLRNPRAAGALGAAGRRRWREHFCFSAFRDRFLGYLRSWIG